MKRKNNFTGIIVLVVLVAIAGGFGFVYLSPQFEQNKPEIKFEEKEYWNLKDSLKISIDDNSGIKHYKVIYKDDNNERVLEDKILDELKNSIDLEIKPPKLDMFFKGENVSIILEATDRSKWNFFEGNSIRKEYKIKIDKKIPVANVIGNSFAIRHGGSALVIVEVHDENLKDAYISFNDEERFDLIPFYKENFYIALIAWPVTIEEFKRVNLIAIDKANNKTITKVPLYIRALKVKNDNIKLSEKFVKDISVNVLQKSGLDVPSTVEEIFVKENRILRKMNTDVLKEITRKFMNKDKIDSFSIKPFKRLEGSKTVAGYADRRHYYFNDEKIDQAWHLGMDWASIKNASIKATNSGKVIFNDYLGIYGNTIVIDHKLGLQSLYAHTSKSHVMAGEEVRANTKIANTGSTGAVFGDHLHFGVLVQGIEVNPLEWMDKDWIKTRITDVIIDAKKVINSK
ncbi:M23 family metallopeptidase [Malaciobacter mytili]|uniref:Peptidase M24 n=1 Tax=Malaciobacter mytili LMG 24559 TaxID=1032238 RepID=A0AAX2AHM9_9BACT|nr:M23 family metallopeptidase [Malaciobacter mytili]AXH13952.1 zinc metallopeptidase, M23 family [Malaciobacter mytili LMG 24559]RXK15867.1 peptidase M24 [Malaciobacter mytili LMG 24559]